MTATPVALPAFHQSPAFTGLESEAVPKASGAVPRGTVGAGSKVFLGVLATVAHLQGGLLDVLVPVKGSRGHRHVGGSGDEPAQR